jgi:RNA polymerase-binding transcription factor DksA
MADTADAAQAYQERMNAAALAAFSWRAGERPLVVGGRRLCVCCRVRLPAGRLGAVPEAVRCVDCEQAQEEARGGLRSA